MARRIKLGYGKQLFFVDNNCKVEYKGQTVHQCNNPRDWKNSSGQYIKDLCNKSFGEVVEFLGYSIWIFFYFFKLHLQLFSFKNRNKINKWKRILECCDY